jgi:hypothetical protein
MLLAARALYLGTTLTRCICIEKEAEAVLGLPASVHSYALLPIGYPMGRFGPVRRVPLVDVVYEDRWVRLTGICSDLVAFTRRCLSGRTDRLASVILNVRGRS